MKGGLPRRPAQIFPPLPASWELHPPGTVPPSAPVPGWAQGNLLCARAGLLRVRAAPLGRPVVPLCARVAFPCVHAGLLRAPAGLLCARVNPLGAQVTPLDSHVALPCVRGNHPCALGLPADHRENRASGLPDPAGGASPLHGSVSIGRILLNECLGAGLNERRVQRWVRTLDLAQACLLRRRTGPWKSTLRTMAQRT